MYTITSGSITTAVPERYLVMVVVSEVAAADRALLSLPQLHRVVLGAGGKPGRGRGGGGRRGRGRGRM